MPNKSVEFSLFFDEDFRKNPSDIVVFGFQETVKLTILNVMKGHKDKDCYKLIDQILDALNSTLKYGSSYHLASKIAMVGIILIVFSKVDLENVTTTKMRTGYGGIAGNKGAVVSKTIIYYEDGVFK